MAPGGSIVSSSLGAVQKCLGHLFQVSPPEPNLEVLNLIAGLRLTPRQLRDLYRTFRELKQHDPITLSIGPNEASTASMAYLVRLRRKWVAKILKCLVELGGFTGALSWDGFLYIFLRFCTLSRMELAQVMFFVIARHMKSWTVHFVTTAQLAEFYQEYNDCPVKAFNTSSIAFTQLPLAKYRMVDFVQLTYRFSQLVNPCLHLQRSLKQALLTLQFWENFDNVKPYNRTLTLDFFRNSKMVGIVDLMLGNSDAPDDQKNVEAQRLARDDAFKEVYDPSAPLKVKRHPELDTDFPLPTIPQPQPRHWVPPAPPLPAWLTRITSTNYDPVKGIAVGTAAEPAEGWGVDRVVDPRNVPSVTSVQAAKDIIQATYPATRGMRKPGAAKGGFHPPPDEEVIRAQELEFIRKARDTLVPKRDNIVRIMYKTALCELVDRPILKVQGHT